MIDYQAMIKITLAIVVPFCSRNGGDYAGILGHLPWLALAGSIALSERPNDLARSAGRPARASCLTLAGSIDLGDWPSDVARPGWHNRRGRTGERPGSPWLARSPWANGRTTWLAMAASMDMGDWPSDLARPGWLDLPGNESPSD